MRYRCAAATALVLASLTVETVPAADDPRLPVRDGRPVVATINDGTISLDELAMQLDPPVDRARLLAGRATAAELAVLDRLIDGRLIALEAAAMGLGDAAEIRKQVDVQSRETMRQVLLEQVVKDVVPDPAAVEAAYKDLVREWKTASLLFQDEAAAARVREEVAAGADFEAVAARATADKIARSQVDDAYHRRRDYLPEIGAALEPLAVGAVSPVLRLQAGLVVVKVLDIRYPEDAAARAEAERRVYDRQRQEAVRAHEQSLRAEAATVDAALLEALDYTTTDIDAMLKDTRPVAQVKGADPVTVADLSDYMRMQFYHGADQVAQGKRLNTRKAAALETILGRRLLNQEALRLGIDKSDAYLDQVNAFEESLVFGTFVQKVIAPESRLRDEDARAYYDAHQRDYASPEMIRMRSLAFGTRAAAEAAMQTLRNGAEFGWVETTAEGRVAGGGAGALSFDGRPVTVSSLPEGMQKALADAKTGALRLYESPEGPFYVLSVQDVLAPEPRPYEDVKAEIGKKLFAEKMNKAIEDYARKLRALAKVEVHLRAAQ